MHAATQRSSLRASTGSKGPASRERSKRASVQADGASPEPAGAHTRPNTGVNSSHRRLSAESSKSVASTSGCIGGRADPQDVMQVFQRFDANGDGQIDLSELVAVLRQLDPAKWDDRNATLLLMSLDKNFDGFIDYSEFVEWVSGGGDEQTEIRKETGMPENQAELEKLEAKRREAALKGTKYELDTQKALAVHRLECLRSSEARRNTARSHYDLKKAQAAKASSIFMPMYERFRDKSSNVSVPAKELLEHDVKELFEATEDQDGDHRRGSRRSQTWDPQMSSLEDGTEQRPVATAEHPPIEVLLCVQGMCMLFNVHPGTKANSEPDYWTTFLEAVLNPKLLVQMEQYDKEGVTGGIATRLKGLCNDAHFIPDRVRVTTEKMGRTGNFMFVMCLWLHFLAMYNKAGVKKLWDEVSHAEVEMKREEVICTTKDEEHKEVRKHISRLEDHLKNGA